MFAWFERAILSLIDEGTKGGVMRRIARLASRGRQVLIALLLAAVFVAMLAEVAWAWNYRY